MADTERDVQVDLVDARDTYGLIVLGKTEEEGAVDLEFKGIAMPMPALGILLIRAGQAILEEYGDG